MKPTTKRRGQRSTGTLQLRPPAVFVLHRQRRHLHQELHHLHVTPGTGSCQMQRSLASGSPYGRDIYFSLKWRKESQPKPVGIERSSPDGHRPQRPRAIVLLQVHLGLGLEKQLDHLRVAVACRWVQRGPASVRSPACGCASGHLPLQSSVPSCWSRCLLQGLFRCMFDRIGQSPHLRSSYQVYHSHADITNRIC